MDTQCVEFYSAIGLFLHYVAAAGAGGLFLVVVLCILVYVAATRN